MSDERPRARLRTLGELSLYRREGTAPRIRNSKSLAVVAFLALKPNRRARRSYLARLLWPDADSKKDRLRCLRQALYYLTDRADVDVFRRDNGELGLREDRVAVDLWAFERAVEADDYRRAVELYGGSFLEGFEGSVSREFRHWREAQTERIWSGLKLAYRRLIHEKLEENDPDTAISYGRQYRNLNPLDETARKLLLRALIEDNREVEAHQEYEEYATLLAEELDDTPSDELEARAREVRDLLLESHAEREPETAEIEWEPSRTTSGGSGFPDVRFVGLGAAVLLFASLWLWSEGAGGPAVPSAFEEISANIAVTREASDRQWNVQIRRGEAVGAARTDLGGASVRRPGHPGQAVGLLPSPTGLDLALFGVEGTTDTLRLTDRPHDEHPLAFSPDGRFLLYDMGVEARTGERYDLYPAILEPATGARRLLAGDSLTRIEEGDWSPYGPRIALSGRPNGGSLDIWVVPFHGDDLQKLTRHPATDRDPRWSPEASRIAFTSDRSGNDDVYVIRPDGTDLRQITQHPGPDRSPVWLSSHHVGYVSDRGGDTELWGFYLPTGERRRLTSLGDVRSALDAEPRQPRRWIESVEIQTERERLVPGEFLHLEASVYDRRGRRTSEAERTVRWTFSRSARMNRVDEGGLYHVGAPAGGPVEVRADVGGWRADTLRLRPASVFESGAPLRFAERWSGRPLKLRWIAFGKPVPSVRSIASSRFPRAVDPEGDEHFDSGLVTAEPVRLTGGATVSVWARAVFTQQLYQSFAVALAPDRPEAGRDVWRDRRSVSRLKVSPAGRRLKLLAADTNIDIPHPGDPARWHRYTLQVQPDGTVWFLVDGELLWRSADRLDMDALPRAHLALLGRSKNTEIYFGRVRVYGSPRFRIR